MLLILEKKRADHLQDLQTVAANILQIRKEKYDRISTLLKSRKMLHIKQQQVKDEFYLSGTTKCLVTNIK